MRPYEVMIIFDPALEDSVLQEQVDRYSEFVSTRGATLGRVDRWGKRRLAYELQHNQEGYYIVMGATAEPATMTELNRALQLADQVLRHKVIRLPDRIAARERSSPSVDGDVAGPERPQGAGSTASPVMESAQPDPVAGDGETVAASTAAEETTIDANGA